MNKYEQSMKTKKSRCFVLMVIMSVSMLYGQDRLLWNANRKLKTQDFKIHSTSVTTPCFAQFYIENQLNGIDFLRKNFNKKVSCYMISSASWIDTTQNVNQMLQYQQVLFDMSEVFTRKFRKALRENRSKIANGFQIVQELNDRIMTDFSNERLNFEKETKMGIDIIQVGVWETKINEELDAFSDYAYEK